jgi:hypothetical protein
MYTQDELDNAIERAIRRVQNNAVKGRPLTRTIGTAAHEAAATNGKILVQFGDKQGFTTNKFVQPDRTLGESWVTKTYQYCDNVGGAQEFDPQHWIEVYAEQRKLRYQGKFNRSFEDIGVVRLMSEEKQIYSVRLDAEHRVVFIQDDGRRLRKPKAQ